MHTFRYNLHIYANNGGFYGRCFSTSGDRFRPFFLFFLTFYASLLYSEKAVNGGLGKRTGHFFAISRFSIVLIFYHENDYLERNDHHYASRDHHYAQNSGKRGGGSCRVFARECLK